MTSSRSGWTSGSTRAHRRVRTQVLERDGGVCQIRRPGCTHIATQAHHVLGRAVTGDDPSHLVAACASCNLDVGDPQRSDPQPLGRTAW